MAAAAPAAVRGSDRKKQQFEWVDVKRVQEYEDGWYLGYLDHPTDLATLGRLMGHCSGTHFVWACEERIWYFFALFDKDGVPHGTLHAKEKKWLGKDHPRDKQPPIPQKNPRGIKCPNCNGWGEEYKNGRYKRCTKCGASGFLPAPDDANVIEPIRASAGGYPSFEDVKAAFEKAGLQYESGKYCALQYNSRTYEGGAQGDYYGGARDFDRLYPDVFRNTGKPEGVEDALWAEYTKLFKKLRDEYNKNNGFIKIAGRVFKFDGKELIVLSWADKDQYGEGKQAYRKLIAEFLNDHTKSKRVTKTQTEQEVAA